MQAAQAAHDQQLLTMSQQLEQSKGETATASEMIDWLKASLETAHADLDAAQNKALQESSRVLSASKQLFHSMHWCVRERTSNRVYSSEIWPQELSRASSTSIYQQQSACATGGMSTCEFS